MSHIKISFLTLTVLLLVVASCTKKESDKMFIVTAHRGASGLAPENTLAAFKKAMEIGADFSELDVHLSADGEVVLLHDDTLDRTTNGSGPIYEWKLADLKKLDAGSWFSPEFAGEPLPTLREVIQLVKGKMKLNIEIKISGNEPDIAERVVDIVRSEQFDRDCMITSFDRATVEKVKEIAPDLKVGLIFSTDYPEDVFEGNWEVLSSNKKNVNKGFVQKAHTAGKELHVWTVNEKEKMVELINLGVDGIITNYPNRLIEVLKEMGRR